MHHRHERDDGGGGDESGDDPLLEPIKDAVEHAFPLAQRAWPALFL
jgi:hypothetical protein